jgi:hypothetical protein
VLLLLLLLPLVRGIKGVLLLHVSGKRGAHGIAIEVKGRRYVGGLAKGEGDSMCVGKHGSGRGYGAGLQRLGLLVGEGMGRGLLIGAEICGRPLRIRGLGVDILGVLRRLGGIVLHPLVPVGHVVSGSRERHVVAGGGEPRSAHAGKGEVAREQGIFHLGRVPVLVGDRRIDGRGTGRESEVVKHAVGSDLRCANMLAQRAEASKSTASRTAIRSNSSPSSGLPYGSEAIGAAGCWLRQQQQQQQQDGLCMQRMGFGREGRSFSYRLLGHAQYGNHATPSQAHDANAGGRSDS